MGAVSRRVPLPVKRFLHRRFRDPERFRPLTLARGLLALRGATRRGADPAPAVSRLARGWGNQRYAADPALVVAAIDAARRSSSGVVECGSGLTTIALAVAVRPGGPPVSLEHDEAWARSVRRRARWCGGARVDVRVRPLADRGEADWYDVRPGDVPARVGLLVCDGPPRDTRGGRHGVVGAVAAARPDVVLLDDTDRASEAALAQRLQDELGYRLESETDVGRRRFTTLVRR